MVFFMKYRNEWKFLCNNIDTNIINSKLKAILKYDEHCNDNHYYIVHSLYFDDYYNDCMFENDAGINARHKWRIRYYNDDISHITLERKEKLNGMCRKKSCFISEDEYNNIINGDYNKIIYKTDKEVLKMFCIEAMTKLYKPKVIIDYERVALNEPISNVRITFDQNISASKDISKFLNNNYVKVPILNTNNNIVEIKFDDILPGYINKVMYISNMQQITFSKYYISRKRLKD